MGLHRELRRCPTEVFKVSAWFLLAALCRGKRLKEDLVSRKDGLGHSQPTQIVEYAKIRRVTVWKATLERKSEKWLDDLLVPGKDQNVPGIWSVREVFKEIRCVTRRPLYHWSRSQGWRWLWHLYWLCDLGRVISPLGVSVSSLTDGDSGDNFLTEMWGLKESNRVKCLAHCKCS